MQLVIGNRNYSSWSLRPWLAMRHCGIPFEEIRIPLYTGSAKQAILRHSPAGKVPVLVAPGATIWESLAILEYLAERFPDRRMWPDDAAQRAHARAISAEMHAGFGALRANLCMNLRRRFPDHAKTPEVLADIARVQAIWTGCLDRSGGPFLFGAFTNADAMFAPVATRFITYSVDLSAPCAGYVVALRSLPAMEEWYQAALQETEVLPQFEREP
ncbi:MAG: glutathione S-transferase family protein [Burkholderiales bacterium]|nr:glutathione S-transferase family protein [Burkholderiales bacterium]